MKDVYRVLRQKESDLARVRKEIESLTIAVQLLSGDQPTSFDPLEADGQTRKPAQRATLPEGPGNEPFVWPRLGFWGNLKIRR